MLKNYFKTAWRNLMKNKTFSLINIAGLSIGMAACLLILQYVSFELSFDRFNNDAKDIYRVSNDRYQNGKLIQHGTITYSAIGKAMKTDFPEVVDYARVEPVGTTIITYGLKKNGEQEGIAVEPSFLNMFNYPLLYGQKSTALTDPNSVIFTASAARKIFGVANKDLNTLIGKSVVIQRDSLPYKVTAICEDVPENSHLKFDFMMSYITLYSGPYPWKEADYDFKDSDFWHYVKLKPGTNYKALEAKLPAFSERHFQGNKVSGSDEKFHLQPLLRAHLYSDFEYEIGVTGSSTVVWGMLIIAILTIVIAWVNYINLSTAKSTERAKEVGVRKVSGATRSQLVRQFLTESLLLNVIALAIAIGVVFLVQSPFNNLIKHQLSLSYLFQSGPGGFNITIPLVVLLVGGILISGFYPAFVISSFRPVSVLKGKYSSSKKGILLRKILVVGQFAATVALIIGSFVVYQQIKFINRQSLGYNISQMLIVKPPELTNWDSTFIGRENALMEEMKKIPHVLGVANSNRIAGAELGRNFNVRRANASDETHFTVRFNAVSQDYLNIYEMKLLAGRNFVTTDYNPDWNKLHNLIVNESTIKLLGFKSAREAIGQSIKIGDNRSWDIVGVISDFHQKSLRYAVEPTIFRPAYSPNSPISVKVETTDLTKTMAEIKSKYDSFFPGNLFDYFFLDQKFNEQYSNDLLFGKIFALFSGFAIFISCLGLLGLSLFTTAQRTKEIGVRKVLGASIGNIVLLLSKDFIRLVLIAFIIASPVAWFIMHNWLQDFAYRINISWWVFAASGTLAVIIALATISFQAIKAALSNPVKSLRTE
ncbi:MAG: hypothetical protein C5B52_18285 [Bacteroidetes bacterium]|nr:MAG: hypothetical protein C5B52_18285 [Bacteroidota bacterium]